MKFKQHYSGSSGNFYEVVSDEGKRLLIDPGVSWPKIQIALDYDLGDIVGCLLSHEHADHSKAVEDVIRAGIDVYSSYGTLEALDIFGKRKSHVLNSDPEQIDCFKVLSWMSHHDAIEPSIFVISCDGEYMLFATDTSHITQKFWFPFSIIAIECSYNGPYLHKREREGTINTELAKRLLTSHMEESVTMQYLDEFCDLRKCEEVHLLHMSSDNINKTRIKKKFKKQFFITPIIIED